MGKRKTIEIEKLVDYANEQLRYSVMNPHFRDGIIQFVERVLLENDRYAGYRYLDIDEVPKGLRPGIRFAADGTSLPYEERFVDTDNTRREYAFKK